MLPLHTMPDSSVFPLPWSADGDAWYEALQAALEGAVTAQRRGRFASRLEKPRPQPRWQRRERKTALRLARVHAPLFTPRKSSPCYAMPSKDLLRKLASRPLVEVAGGSGAWGLLVAAAGGDVVVTDPRPWPMGHSYDLRGTREDSPFSKRQRLKRGHPRIGVDRLVKEYGGVWDSRPTRFSMRRSGPARMAFPKTWRPGRVLRAEPGFSPVLRMGGAEAASLFPDRDLLAVMPDPADDGWVCRLLDSLGSGRRIYFLEDDCGFRSAPKGYRLLSAYEARPLRASPHRGPRPHYVLKLYQRR